jgi:hypothetical protein
MTARICSLCASCSDVNRARYLQSQNVRRSRPKQVHPLRTHGLRHRTLGPAEEMRVRSRRSQVGQIRGRANLKEEVSGMLYAPPEEKVNQDIVMMLQSHVDSLKRQRLIDALLHERFYR